MNPSDRAFNELKNVLMKRRVKEVTNHLKLLIVKQTCLNSRKEQIRAVYDIFDYMIEEKAIIDQIFKQSHWFKKVVSEKLSEFNEYPDVDMDRHIKVLC